MSCNPGRPECFLGQCGFCPWTDAIKQKLIYELEEKGLETVTYKQWASTDRCDLITIQNDLDECCDILCAKLKILGPHDFIAKQQSQFLRSLKEQLAEVLVISVRIMDLLYKMRHRDTTGQIRRQLCIHPLHIIRTMAHSKALAV